MASDATCPDCGQPVIRALTEERRWQLLNPTPDEAGRVAAAPDATATWHARTLVADQRPAALEKRYMPHYATAPGCREAWERRRRQTWSIIWAGQAARLRTPRGRHAAPRPARRKESP